MFSLYNIYTIDVGLANTKTVSVQPGGRDSVVLSTTKTRKQNKPASLQHKSVMKKDFSRMVKAVNNQVMDEIGIDVFSFSRSVPKMCEIVGLVWLYISL